MNWFQRFYAAAKNKLTTYMGLAVASSSALTAKSEDLLNQIPQITPYLPPLPKLQTILHFVTGTLGLLVVYTRVRRLLGEQPK